MKIYKVYYNYQELVDYDRNFYEERESDDEYNTYHLSYDGAAAQIKINLREDEAQHALKMEDNLRQGYPAHSFCPVDYYIREITLEP